MAKPSSLQDLNPPRLYVEGFTAGTVTHGFFGRQGGVSAGLYKNLNCGHGSGDETALVRENRALVAGALGVKPENLLSLYQVHGTDCIHVDEAWTPENRPQADAMITDKKGMGLGILTADCFPVLFNGGKVIAAAHAGWKGALQGVLESTVKKFADYNVKPERITACIGPGIAQKSYEVSADFLENFTGHDPANERFFREGRRQGHFLFDLAGFCAARLGECGLAQIFMTDIDTYANEADFFSYRRATHRQEPDYGRQLSVIAIR